MKKDSILYEKSIFKENACTNIYCNNNLLSNIDSQQTTSQLDNVNQRKEIGVVWASGFRFILFTLRVSQSKKDICG